MSVIEDGCTGFPVGNFGISAEVAPDGRIFPTVMYNPPVLGAWLEKLGAGGFRFGCDGVWIRDCEFECRQVDRLFPEASARYSDPRLGCVSVAVKILAPIKAQDASISSIPALCMDIEFANSSGSSKEVCAAFDFAFGAGEEQIRLLSSGGFWLLGDQHVKFGFDRPIKWHGIEDGARVSASERVPGKGAVTLRFLLLCHDQRGFYAERYPDMTGLAGYVSTHWRQLAEDRDQLLDLLPRTHDDEIDRYNRWYLQAGVLLTRITAEGVLTMGYSEMNQRDSFWTSWLHLVLWTDLERAMIEESARFQRPNGKIPTTILPVIERGDDIDINEYFNLRIARYCQWTHDLEFVRKMWPSFKLSIEYLKGMDNDGDGLLDQGSYWGDWKDVRGVEGRKAAPHFEFLWLAVLKYGKEYGSMLDDASAFEEYSSLYDRSYKAIHAPVEEGGLWNGRCYTSLWYDGRNDQHVQEDQCVGPLYGVVPDDRQASVYCELAGNMSPWGMRDTYPYREKFSHEGGDYHNGGVWVFLNFADALSRFVSGHPAGAEEIMRRVGRYDLEDYMPAEYLDGNTGATAGKPIQAWDADFFAAVFFGILGVKMPSAEEASISPRIADTESFETNIVLPLGVLHIRQMALADRLEIEITSKADRKIRLRYGAMTSKSIDGGREERIGECVFKVVELVLGAGEKQKVITDQSSSGRQPPLCGGNDKAR